EGKATVHTRVVDGHHVGMGQAGGGHRLLPEARHQGFVPGHVGMEDLDGHGAVENLVPCLPDLGHTATGQRPQEPVAPSHQALGHDVGGGVGHGATVLTEVAFPAAPAGCGYRYVVGTTSVRARPRSPSSARSARSARVRAMTAVAARMAIPPTTCPGARCSPRRAAPSTTAKKASSVITTEVRPAPSLPRATNMSAKATAVSSP